MSGGKFSGRYVRVRNLERYQHYRERCPPWIKLHQELLEDVDFAMLPDAAKYHAIASALLASRTDNRLPADPRFLAARINARGRVDIDLLVSVGFFEVCEDCGRDASAPIATCSGEERRGEDIRQESRDTIDHARRVIGLSKDQNGFDRWWPIYPRKVGKRKAREAWQRLRKSGELPPSDDVIAATVRLAASEQWRRDGGKYVPHPTTWLNRGGWEDEPDQPSGGGAYGSGYDPQRDFE